ADQLVGLPLQGVRPQPASVLDHQLEAARDAQAGIAGAPKATTRASLISSAQACRSRAMMASELSSGLVRFSNGSRTMNIDAKLGLLACNTNDMPEIVIVWATPGVRRAIASILATASSVRWREAESGSWMLQMIRPWSCAGTKPVGALWKTHPVSTSRPP